MISLGDIRRRVTADAIWIATGQVASAVGAVVGVRLLTQFIRPETFGFFSLALGVIALCVNVMCTPFIQAAMHYYPIAVNERSIDLLRRSLVRCFVRLGAWMIAPIGLLSIGYLVFAEGSLAVVILLVCLLACDCVRTAILAFHNASENHRRYALLIATDACARPLLAAFAARAFGDSALIIIGAYLVASLITLTIYTATYKMHAAPQQQPATERLHTSNNKNLEPMIWRYALPLIPLGLISWANGLGDRYLIGGILSVADAGVYAAAYGLASRPFLMISGAIELALRPRYQNRISNGQTALANNLLNKWLIAVIAVSAAGVIAFALFNNEIAALLLGKQFRHGAQLMPWIAFGYGLLITSYVFERVCYAHNQSYRVLLIQLCTVTTGLIVTAAGAFGWGLIGAAIAVPVYFAVQLGVAGVAASGTLKQANLQVGVTPA